MSRVRYLGSIGHERTMLIGSEDERGRVRTVLVPLFRRKEPDARAQVRTGERRRAGPVPS